MTITNPETGTRIDEVEDRIYRISTPVDKLPGGFSFDQYLIDDDEPLLFHTGPHKLFPLVRDAISRVMPVERLRYIGFSHFEADECGLAQQIPGRGTHGRAALRQDRGTGFGDIAEREARALEDGEIVWLGRRQIQWFDTPHMPHAWECGVLFERTTRTLLCSDLFTEGGSDHPPITEGDILEPSERFRQQMDYYSHTRNARQILARVAEAGPTLLARMHGSAWRGNGGEMLLALAEALEG